MSVILKQPDDRLCRTDITALQVCTDLVVLLGCRETDRCLVSAFVNILVDGFAGLDGGANLNVDVGVVLEAEIRAVRNDPRVVNQNLLVVDPAGN